MARRSGAALLLVGALALLFVGKVFVPAPRAASSEVALPATVAGLAAVVADAQMASARIPGGQWEKKLNQVLLFPDEEGFTDGQVAFALVIALVCGVLALNLGKELYKGVDPDDYLRRSKKNYTSTPLAVRRKAMGWKDTQWGTFL
eukprot:TRINITY_DN3869_c0_g3_i1.p2 TRINITY_DN3869_c0_g3~~TRINITY_DN3869_c0_g3_i1.p2  ORF type:complete len:146 (+),score=53.63 TRINITY_DN3869_c0_g3_i1:79-516(+)